MTKKKTSFSLSAEALEQLAFISKDDGRSQASMLEALIKKAYGPLKEVRDSQQAEIDAKKAAYNALVAKLPFKLGDRFKVAPPREAIGHFWDVKEWSDGIGVRFMDEGNGPDRWYYLHEIKEPLFTLLPDK